MVEPNKKTAMDTYVNVRTIGGEKAHTPVKAVSVAATTHKMTY